MNMPCIEEGNWKDSDCVAILVSFDRATSAEDLYKQIK